ncbi:helix-turn-helix transcriptional regulator [uncultured Treponema sp.]|uniref:helix-turn-helix domain-containing protein n=1 Tax=uncultured Treponema sp. TaxID=162155 RepID=UPI0025D2E288|nr:helix-turn-helix transcriptional regulator [uncultured Treponema sp.]
MTEYQENFIIKMRFYRKQAGITQAKLAELCGVSSGTIGNIECGITKPSFDLIIRIAEAIKIPPANLFKTELYDYYSADDSDDKQIEDVQESLNSAVNQAVFQTLKGLKFRIVH